jgi:integrase
LFLLLARTGMRIGEALGLQWGDVDFAGRFIEVKRQYSKGRVSTPKNGKSRRVDMSSQLCGTLTDLQAETFPLGEIDMERFVFTNQAGNPIDLDGWRRRVFDKALTKAELRKIRVHDLRHSYATIRISEGHDIIDVSHQLGHHAESFTLKVYNHWKPGKRKSEVDALDDRVSQHPSAPYTHPGVPEKEKWAPEPRVTH